MDPVAQGYAEKRAALEKLFTQQLQDIEQQQKKIDRMVNMFEQEVVDKIRINGPTQRQPAYKKYRQNLDGAKEQIARLPQTQEKLLEQMERFEELAKRAEDVGPARGREILGEIAQDFDAARTRLRSHTASIMQMQEEAGKWPRQFGRRLHQNLGHRHERAAQMGNRLYKEMQISQEAMSSGVKQVYSHTGDIADALGKELGPVLSSVQVEENMESPNTQPSLDGSSSNAPETSYDDLGPENGRRAGEL